MAAWIRLYNIYDSLSRLELKSNRLEPNLLQFEKVRSLDVLGSRQLRLHRSATFPSWRQYSNFFSTDFFRFN